MRRRQRERDGCKRGKRDEVLEILSEGYNPPDFETHTHTHTHTHTF